MIEVGSHDFQEKKRNGPENVFLNTKGAKKKIISVQMKPVREKESVRERVKGESVEEKR